MKHLNLLNIALFLLVFWSSSFAQEKGEGHKVGGIRAGWQSSQYFNDGNSITGTTPYSSFYVGFYRDTRIVPILHFGSGLEYFQNASFIDDNNKRVLHYIGVPLYIKLKLGPVFALTGFEPSFKVGEKAILLGKEYEPTSSSNWFDAPFFLGAGLKIFIVSVEFRYHWGTIGVYDEVKSQYFQLGAAISF